MASLRPIPRVLEPEIMDTEEEARDYDAMDHREVNARFCDDLLAQGTIGPNVLDIGSGTALIPIELATRAPDVRIVAVDLAEHMLALARKNIARAHLEERVTVAWIDAKALPFASGTFATTISNSIVHHIPDPRGVLGEILRVTAPGGLVFVRDLVRPPSDAEVDRLVALYGGVPPEEATPSFERQRDLLRASLKAALTVTEVASMAGEIGIPTDAVRMTSDRHWTLAFRKTS